jgi:hypothetical protein
VCRAAHPDAGNVLWFGCRWIGFFCLEQSHGISIVYQRGAEK